MGEYYNVEIPTRDLYRLGLVQRRAKGVKLELFSALGIIFPTPLVLPSVSSPFCPAHTACRAVWLPTAARSSSQAEKSANVAVVSST